MNTGMVVVTTVIGIYFLGAGLQGRLFGHIAKVIARLWTICAGALLMLPGILTNIIGARLAIAWALILKLHRRGDQCYET